MFVQSVTGGTDVHWRFFLVSQHPPRGYHIRFRVVNERGTESREQKFTYIFIIDGGSSITLFQSNLFIFNNKYTWWCLFLNQVEDLREWVRR